FDRGDRGDRREGGFNRGGENRGGGKGFDRDRGPREEKKSFARDAVDATGGEKPSADQDFEQTGNGAAERSFDGGQDRRRGGEGARAGGGRPGERRSGRPDEPGLPDDVQASDLEPAVRRDLLSLDKSNAESVARHLVMVAQLLDEDPELALEHARAARQRAGRIAVVRETAGVAAYHAGEWAEALSELRTARRMSGGAGLLAVMADCERGLGRPERAIELGRSDEARALQGDEATELRIVVAGARMDLGQFDQAVVTLQTAELDPARTGSAAARLFYAYAEALMAADRADEALTWFMNAASADLDGETDAEERAAELSGHGHGEGADWTAAFDEDDDEDEDGETAEDESDSPAAEQDSEDDGSEKSEQPAEGSEN
ncbi:tetratricopeptide repeat protein, partial [Nocardia tengchongensis]